MSAAREERGWAGAGLAALAAVALLAPFLGKAFHVDDPCFLWCARRIVERPLDPYGFSVNWYGSAAPMAEVIRNPPLACYGLALAGALLGWSEEALHGAWLLPAAACAAGTWALARAHTRRPLLAALLLAASPGFLVSATTLMPDVPMLALWVWAAVLWRSGLERSSRARLAGAGLLLAAAALTKLNALLLGPALAVQALGARRRLALWAPPLALPLVAVGAFVAWGRALYGGALEQGFGFAASAGGDRLAALGATLCQVGACSIGALAAALLALRGRALAAALGAWGALAALLLAGGFVASWRNVAAPGAVWAQASVALLAAVALAALALRGGSEPGAPPVACRERAYFLTWILAVVLFTACVSWSVSARYVLPLAPLAAILAARATERVARPALARLAPAAVLAPSLALALLAAQADRARADAARDAARGLWEDWRGRRLWFQGHWGFQWYLQEAGALPLDQRGSDVAPGDRIAVPLNNANVFALKPELLTLVHERTTEPALPLATLDSTLGAGFYASVFGPLPFAFGRPAPLRWQVVELRAP